MADIRVFKTAPDSKGEQSPIAINMKRIRYASQLDEVTVLIDMKEISCKVEGRVDQLFKAPYRQ